MTNLTNSRSLQNGKTQLFHFGQKNVSQNHFNYYCQDKRLVQPNSQNHGGTQILLRTQHLMKSFHSPAMKPCELRGSNFSTFVIISRFGARCSLETYINGRRCAEDLRIGIGACIGLKMFNHTHNNFSLFPSLFLRCNPVFLDN